jgi:hypothetical protein
VLDAALACATAHGVAADSRLTEVRGRRTADVILEAAEAVRADLIVLGTHGRRGMDRAFAGSDAEQILRRAPVPVLLVRLPAAHVQAADPSPRPRDARRRDPVQTAPALTNPPTNAAPDAWWSLDAGALFAALASGPSGRSGSEAAWRRCVHGANEVVEIRTATPTILLVIVASAGLGLSQELRAFGVMAGLRSRLALVERGRTALDAAQGAGSGARYGWKGPCPSTATSPARAPPDSRACARARPRS